MENMEEDYEISNKVVSEYLYNLGFEDDLNQLKEFDKNSAINGNDTPNSKHNQKQEEFFFCPAAFIFKSDFIIELLQTNRKNVSEAVLDLDEQVIIKENLDFHSRLSESCLIDSLFYHKIALSLFFLIFLSTIALSIRFFFLNAIFFFLIISLRYKLIGKIFIFWLNVSIDYLKITRKILAFIKQSDLVELSLKRSHSSNPTQSDINFSLRKFFFFTLRKNFFKLKKINCQFFKNIEQDSENFVCSIKESDLSQVMKISGPDLDKLTDNYSFSCINSIVKLNSLLISENFKMIVLNLFHLLKNGSNFFDFIFLTFKSILTMQKFIHQLKKIDKLSESIDEDKIQIKVQIDQLSDEDKLVMYLRSCLLNSHNLKNKTDNKAKVELAQLVRTGLESCNLYLEQIETTLGMINKNSKVFEPIMSKYESKNETKFDKVVCESIQEPVFEDEIFEADDDIFSVKKESMVKFDTEEISPKEKQELLNTKNLFYELKFALKSKKNEWKEREKRAKHVNSKKKEDLSQSKKENYLLDNDLMLYKSELRKRKEKNSPLIQTNEKNNKYFYDESEECKFNQMSSSILSDLIATRNKILFENNEKEEIFGD